MISLSDCFFEKNRHFHLKGYVAGHPRYPDGTVITTSPVAAMKREGFLLVAQTASGTIYHMELAELNLENDYADDTGAALKCFGFADSMLIESGVLRAKKQVELLKSAGRVLADNEMLLIMAGEETLRAYHKSNNKVKVCPIGVHLGMVQDSVLIGIPEKADFRYFPRGSSCEVYHWSDGLSGVKIQNVGGENVIFRNGSEVLCVKKGETGFLDRGTFASKVDNFGVGEASI
ncbi:MAG: hypothetical protein NC548_34445 [Lachnospiraceae bacterium]|nr:hypothetical protein [Lachnospiraceae bacterium]